MIPRKRSEEEVYYYIYRKRVIDLLDNHFEEKFKWVYYFAYFNADVAIFPFPKFYSIESKENWNRSYFKDQLESMRKIYIQLKNEIKARKYE